MCREISRRRSLLFRAPCITAPLLLALAGAADGAVINSQWATGVSGNWGTAGNWTPAQVPSNGVDTYNVSIGVAGPYTVTLDNDFTINNFDLSGSNATLKLFSAGTSRTLTIQGNFDQGDTTSIVGDDVGLAQQGTLDVTGIATIHGGTVGYVNQFNSHGSIIFSAKSPIDINDTGINHTGTAASWVANNNINFSGNNTLTFGASSVFTISATGNITSSGGSTTITNNGQINKTSAAANSIAAANVALVNTATGVIDIQNNNFSTDGAFTNSGTLRVSNTASKFNVTGAGNFTNFSGGTLTGGTLDLKGTLQFNGADIQSVAGSVTLDGTSAKIVDQTGSTDGLRNAANVNSGGALLIKNGANFTVGASVTNFNVNPGGTFNVGAGSKLTIPAGKTFRAFSGSTFTNIGATTTGGEIVVQGTLRTPTTGITTIGSKLTLDGASADVLVDNTATSALANVATVGATGYFTINSPTARTFTTLAGGGQFNVATGGHLSILGANVNFDIPNGLANLSGGANATLDLGRFTLQGRIRTPLGGVTNLTLNNTTTLDGPASKIVDIFDNSIDLFDKLTLIDTGGTLNVINGREINTTQLTVRGALNVGGTVPGGRPGGTTSHADSGATRGTGTPASRLTVSGNVVQEFGYTGVGDGGRIVVNDPDHHGYSYKVNQGALGGTSTLEGMVDLSAMTGNTRGVSAATAVIAPGAQGECNIGELTIQGGLRLHQGSGFEFDVSSNPLTDQALVDMLTVLNGLGDGPGQTLIDPGVVPLVTFHICDSFVPAVGAVYPVADFGVMGPGAFSYAGLSHSNGIEVAPVWTGSVLNVMVTAVPAPGAGAALLGACLPLLKRRRR